MRNINGYDLLALYNKVVVPELDNYTNDPDFSLDAKKGFYNLKKSRQSKPMQELKFKMLKNINKVLKDTRNYQGDLTFRTLENQYQNMKNFTEIPEPPKEIKPSIKYVETEQYKKRVQEKQDKELFEKISKNKNYFHSDTKIIDEQRKNLQSKFQRIIHTSGKMKELLKDLPKHVQQMNDYNRLNADNSLNKYFDEIYSGSEQNLQRMRNYKDWLKNAGKTTQEELVNNRIEKMMNNITDWCLELDDLTTEGRNILFPKLIQFFHDYIDNLPITNKFNFGFKVDNQWYSKPLTPELYNKLMENFTLENLIFNIDNKPPEYFYEQGSMNIPEWSLFSAIRIAPISQKKSNNDTGGNFFQYLTNKLPNHVVEYLSRLQIFDKLVDNTGKCRNELQDSCYVYALMQTNGFSESELNKIRLRLNNRYQTQSNIDEINKEFLIHMKLTYIDEDANSKNKKSTVRSRKSDNKKQFLGVKESEAKHIIHVNLFQHHYFIEERTPFTSYYIKNIDTEDEENYNKRLKGTKYVSCEAEERRFIKSSNLVRELFKSGHFKPITFGEYKVVNTIFFNEIDNELNYDLEYNQKSCLKQIIPGKNLKQKESEQISYWYADFEADVSGKYHIPYMCVLQSINGSINKEFRGTDCNKQLLDFLPNDSVIYFHNLAYDIRMLAQYGIKRSIIKGTKVMRAKIKYNGKKLDFKDTLPILSCKLSKLPEMFGIEGIQKEIFPYKYYTIKNLENNYGVISEAGANEDKIWNQKDYDLFNENIDKIGARIDDDHFDMWEYASFYCQQDVKILRLGFNEFRKGFLKDFSIDPFNFVSISSLANEVFNQRVYYPNKGLYKIGGHVRHFCSKAIYGGRCMCAFNKMWHVMRNVSDFDAVSLYPSAMRRLYTVQGIPHVIPQTELNFEFLSKQSAYIVEINITKVNKHYAFPLIVRKVNGLNLNDDNLADGEIVKMVVDNIMLEDLIEFQKIEFEFVKGYYWDGEKDYTIQNEIQNIFYKRKEYQKAKNPLQNLYKLIMNSCYGKTIEKPVDKEYKYFKSGDELDNYWYKNYNKIVEDVKLLNSDIHAVKTLKPIDKHFNFSLLGIQVLSMSKRIMNEVMCLAFDIGCRIYYQDTDSFMIETEDLPKLERHYFEKYNRVLTGSDLGQFHSDFPAIKDHKEMPWSVESYYIMKKMYVHKITDSTKDIDYVIRGKGLTLSSIIHARDRWFNGNILNLYNALYNEKALQFDLTKGQPMLTMNKDMSVSTNNYFQRTVKATYQKGKCEDYFNY